MQRRLGCSGRLWGSLHCLERGRDPQGPASLRQELSRPLSLARQDDGHSGSENSSQVLNVASNGWPSNTPPPFLPQAARAPAC